MDVEIYTWYAMDCLHNELQFHIYISSFFLFSQRYQKYLYSLYTDKKNIHFLPNHKVGVDNKLYK